MSRITILLGGMGLLATGLGAAAAQERQGPVAPPPKREVIRIPVEPSPEPPPVPVEEIIRRFTAKESELKQAWENYSHRQTVRVQEFEEGGSPGGEFQLASDILLTGEGKRQEKVVRQPPSTLRHTVVTQEDLDELRQIRLFVLTSEQISRYDFTYVGKQAVDELNTYLFRVQPKRLERTQQQFEGLVWVDDRDLVIVKTYGKMVAEADAAARKPLFSIFETYRENIDKYWFPSYTRADEAVERPSGDVRIRLTIRRSDYKPAGPTRAPIGETTRPTR